MHMQPAQLRSAVRTVSDLCDMPDTGSAPHRAALYPLDTIKTRLQTATSGGGLAALMRSGGGRALYSGVFGNLAGVVPASAIFMGVYEPVKQARAAG